jgi:hypothetical protein
MAGLMQRAARRLGQQCVLLCGARDRALAGAAGLSSSPRPGRDEHAAADRAEPGTVAIDRSGLYQPREHSHGALPHKEPETPVARHLKALIQVPVAAAAAHMGCAAPCMRAGADRPAAPRSTAAAP